MRRVVSVWFPHWPTDRLSAHPSATPPPGPHPGPSPDAVAPIVTAWHDGRRRVVAAVDAAAAALGLAPGLAIAQALALVPGLAILEADPEADRAALQRLALWCHRITPLTAVDGQDGLWLDITGCSHRAGSEAALLHRLLARFARDGLAARAAAADTPAAAAALAHHAETPVTIVPPGEQARALGPLPIAALRLPAALEATLRRLGFETVRHLSRIPRPLLARRFGPLPGLRLDQAKGCVQEPLQPLPPEQPLQHRIAFLEPLSTAEALATAIAHLVHPLCTAMERSGLGARQLDLLFERVDGHVAAIRAGTVRPSRDAPHLVRMLADRLDTVDPGLGIEAMRLVVPWAEPLRWTQQQGGAAVQDVARLVDRLTSRLGPDRVFQATPCESERPDRSVAAEPPHAVHDAPLDAPEPPPPAPPARPALVPSSRPVPSRLTAASGARLALVAPTRTPAADPLDHDTPVLAWKGPWAGRRTLRTRPTSWPTRLLAPARLFEPPRPIEAMAALPDQPPVAFTWRNRRHRVRRAEGPERVHGEWWRRDDETQAVRDYFQVEDDRGQRFWLFRHGNGLDPATGDLSWFLHGLF